MNVELKAITQPVLKFTPTEPKTPADFISYCARVSNPENQMNFGTSEKLIKYLIKKSHWSPFEMVDLVFEIKTTRDIGRQILRHRSFSFQEFSQRYAAVSDDEPEIRECRLQDPNNRQSSIVTEDVDTVSQWTYYQLFISKTTQAAYKYLVGLGIAKEQARVVLPEGLTPSTMYMKGSVRSWFHYCLVRMHPGTQKEHRLIATEIWRELQTQFDFFTQIDMEMLSIEYQELFETLLEKQYAR